MKTAVIDIGSNSILLLIVEIDRGNKPNIIEDQIEITRLGEGLKASGLLNSTAQERSAKAIEKYLQIISKHNPNTVKLIGTAALRRAKNSSDFIELVRKRCAAKIEVISEEEEATLTFESAKNDFGDDITVIDIGGGSTEIASETGLSLPLGCIDLTEEFLKSDPVKAEEVKAARKHIHASLSFTPVPTSNTRLIANAGTATTLGSIKLALKKYDRNKVHGLKLQSRELEKIIENLSRLTIDERKKINGLMKERAELILAGSLILDEIMNWAGKEQVIISDLGVRWGIVTRLLKALRR